MPVCCASCCSNKSLTENSKTFYLFPFSQPEICKKWVMNVNGDKWQPNQNAVICSDHFEEDQFDLSGPTVKLKQCAVPTLFNSSKQDSSLTNDPSSNSSLESTLKSRTPSHDQSQLSNIKISSVTSLAHSTENGPQVLLLKNQSLSSSVMSLPIQIDLIVANNKSILNSLGQTADTSSPPIKRRKIFITSIEKLSEKSQSTSVKDASLKSILTEPIKPVATPIAAAPAPIKPAPTPIIAASVPIGPPPTPIRPTTLLFKPHNQIEQATTMMKPATTQSKPVITLIRPALKLFKPTPKLIGSPIPMKPAATLIKPATTLIKPATTQIKPATTLIKPATTLIKPATTLIKPAVTQIKPAVTQIELISTDSDPKSTVLTDHHYYTKVNSEVSVSLIKPKPALSPADVNTKRNNKLKPLQQKVRRLETKIRSMNKTIDSLKKEQANSKDMFTKQASTVLTNLQRSAASSSKVTSCTAVFIRSLY